MSALGVTRREFWTAARFSQSTFYKMKRLGLGPHEANIPGTAIIRIVESHDAWRARMAALADSKAARLERERRRQRAIIAARASVAVRAEKKKQKDQQQVKAKRKLVVTHSAAADP
jgi:hypothetical protein